MAAANLLALIDEIASLLDDVATMTKTATQKTAGVLGDDLALNAQQVAGVRADRELPVVWAVAKGSLVNKAILVPVALLISAFLPWAIVPMLMIGGLYLCFEGAEKLAHTWLHSTADDTPHHDAPQEFSDPGIDLVALEKEKIKGAIRTDFVLSIEIIVIALGILADQPMIVQVAALIGLALLITTGVYGVVAAIVKLDDLGLYLYGKASPLARAVGKLLLLAAPRLMQLLTIAGTVAMFLVGGGILVEHIPTIHHEAEHLAAAAGSTGFLVSKAIFVLAGLVAGALVLGAAQLGRWTLGAAQRLRLPQ
ncbi:MAG: DUF808 domain-containing protein [Azoarcus sp.]|jgi:predicted DNA repair protein MutK|nr:DUF808 domain-containing protein [Azoarcus sp.]